MKLSEKQQQFARMVEKLLHKIHTSRGFAVTIGAAYCTPCKDCRYFEYFGHKIDGKHPKKLAIDLNLFKDGVYLRKTSDHQIFGEYWESLGGTWGGRFNDGNHYEL